MMHTYWFKESKASGVSWVLHDSVGSLVGVGFKRISKTWKIKVMKLKAKKMDILWMLSFFGYVVSLLLVESDLTKGIVSLVDVDYDLLEIKRVACTVLAFMADIHFAKCLHFCNSVTRWLDIQNVITQLIYIVYDNNK